MNPKLFIESIRFNDGTEYPLTENSITLLVGPNNAGKSAALKNIYGQVNPASGMPSPHAIVTSATWRTAGSADDLVTFLKSTDHFNPQVLPNQYLVGNQGTSEAGVIEWWSDVRQSPLPWLFIKFISTDFRLSYANNVQIMDNMNERPWHALHRLYYNDELEQQVNTYFRRAFGSDLILDRLSGKFLNLHVGNKPVIAPGEDRMSKSYVDKLKSLPVLQSQGDGVKSFATLALELTENFASILLIDEPEAFLHPPQAFLLGRLIGSLAAQKQLFIATHSSDFIKGVIENSTVDVNIIRIERKGTSNVPSLLNANNLRRIWADPILRFSPIVDGLFHEQVFLCESDGDCRFFSTLFDSLYGADSRSDKIFDSLFVAAHGKAKLPAICRALGLLSVPTAVVCDFDVFNNQSPLQELIEAKGGLWTDFEPEWRVFKASIDGLKSQLSKKEVKEKINQLLDASNGENLSTKDVDKIKEILKISTAWSFAKVTGISFVPAGDAHSACTSTIENLMHLGIYVLPVGELESFDRSVGHSNKFKWLETVLSKNLVHDSALIEARMFAKKVIDSVFGPAVSANS